MAMTVVLLTVIAVIALGAPTLALLADRRLKPPRLRTGAEDVLRELARAHRLSDADVAEVRTAVRLGEEVDPRLRPVVLGYATELSRRSNLFASWPRRRRRALGVALVVLLAASLPAAFVYSVDRRHYFNAFQVVVLAGYYIGIIIYSRHRTRALHRAVSLATTPPATDRPL